jgi:hypothetical protein
MVVHLLNGVTLLQMRTKSSFSIHRQQWTTLLIPYGVGLCCLTLMLALTGWAGMDQMLIREEVRYLILSTN